MKRPFTLGRLLIEVATASDGHWDVTAKTGYKHTMWLGFATVRHPQLPVKSYNLTLGPISLTVADILQDGL